MVVTPEAQYGVNAIGSFIQSNLFYLVGLAVIVYIAYDFIKIRSKKPKIISRSIIEKQKRIDELKYNKATIPFKKVVNGHDEIFYPTFKNLFHGQNWLGKITSIACRVGNPDNELFLEIVFSPAWFGKLASPFKKDIVRVSENSIEPIAENQNSIQIKPEITLDSHMGLFYDVPSEEKHLNFINETLFKHDSEELASQYYVESQKKSTLDLDYAHEMAMKEKDLQIELAKKRGKMSSI